MWRSMPVYVLAAVLEIGGCLAVWQVVRGGGAAWRLIPAGTALAGFAWLLARSDQAFAGRAFAAYGGVYVAMCLAWLWVESSVAPSRTDLLGGGLVLAGAGVIAWGGRA